MNKSTHDLKTGGRIILRHPVYSAIAVGGLAVALAACLLIALYVSRELSYDPPTDGPGRTFRLLVDVSFSKSSPYGAYTPHPAAAALRRDFPEVETAGRLIPLPWEYSPISVVRGATSFNEDRLYYADPEMLTILEISFLRGRPAGALDRPGTIVLTASMAAKYFGGLDPIGQNLSISGRPTEVTGVIPDSPSNSHLRYKALLAYKTIDKGKNMFWDQMFDPSTYLKIKPNVDLRSFVAKVARLEEPYRRDAEAGAVKHRYVLQPLSSIHLEPLVARHDDIVTDPKSLLVLSLLAAVILILACINFVNLATVQAAGRAKEVGVRKAVGADKAGLIRQFMTESFLLCSAAFTAGMALGGMAMGPFNRLFETAFRMRDLFRPDLLAVAAALFVLTGLAVGLYPAFILSSFRPATALQKGSALRLKGGRVRTFLVVAQFASAAVLIAVTLAMIHQIRFMKNQPLGFDPESKLVVFVPRRVMAGSGTGTRIFSIRDELSRHPAIRSASLSQAVPGRTFPRYRFRVTDGEADPFITLNVLFADEKFLMDYGISLRAGRTILSDTPEREILINETAVGFLGWGSPERAVGRRLNMGDQSRSGGQVVGVIRDFHQAGLQTPIAPLVVVRDPSEYNMISLAFVPGRSRAALDFVRSTWTRLAPDAALESFFPDKDFAGQYAKEEKTLRLLLAVAGVSLLLAALGLVGLASFMAEKRTREIGVRVVLGASPAGIVRLLMREFVRAVLLANLIAAPAAYGIVRRWLQDFAFRSSPWLAMFVGASVLTMVVAVISVGSRSLRTARANPLESLRYE